MRLLYSADIPPAAPASLFPPTPCLYPLPPSHAQGQSALPAGALQAAYSAAKLNPPNGTIAGRMHPYARPSALHASYGIQHPPLLAHHHQMPSMQHAAMATAGGAAAAAAAAQPGMNAMMLLAQAACGDDEQQDDSAAAAAAAAAVGGGGSLSLAGQDGSGGAGMEAGAGVTEMDQDVKPALLAAPGQHGVSGLSLPMIQTRPQQLQHKGSGGSSSSSKQLGGGSKATAAQGMCYYNPSALGTNSNMSMMMPANMMSMMMGGANGMTMQGSPMASSHDRLMPGSATATTAAMAAAKAGSTASPAVTPMASGGASLAPEAAAVIAAGGRPSHAGSSQGGGKMRSGAKVVRSYEDLLAGDDMSTSLDDDDNTGGLWTATWRLVFGETSAGCV